MVATYDTLSLWAGESLWPACPFQDRGSQPSSSLQPVLGELLDFSSSSAQGGWVWRKTKPRQHMSVGWNMLSLVPLPATTCQCIE